MVHECFTPAFKSFVQTIINPQSTKFYGKTAQDRLNFDLLHYIIAEQYVTLCKVQALELSKVKMEAAFGQSGSSYEYLMAVVQMQRNAKLLLKKVTLNTINKDAFRSLLLSEGLMSEELVQKFDYLSDHLFLNILDQIFIKTVINPNMSDIVTAMKHEMTHSVVPENIDNLHSSKEGILKIFKMIN